MDSDVFPFKARLSNTEATVTTTIRLLLALSGVLILIFWGAYQRTAPNATDPLWGRILIALLPFGILLGSYTLSAFRRRLILFWRLFIYTIVAWFSVLTYLNGFSPSYSDGLLFVLVAAGTGFSLGLDRHEPLLPFLGWTIGVPSLALLLDDSSMVDQPVFLVCLLGIPFFFFLILRWRVHTEQRYGEQTRIMERIARGAPLDDVLDDLLTYVEGERPDLVGSVLLLNPETNTLHHGAAPSLPDGYIEAIDGLSIGPTAGSCGTAAYHNKTVIADDIRTDERWADYRHVALEHGLHACWSTPLRSTDGEPLGTFALYYTKPRTPDPTDRRLIEEASHLATVAIERNRQAEALDERKERFRLLAESMRDIVILYSPDGTVQWVSPSVEDVLGWTPEEIKNKKELALVHPEDKDIARRHRTRVWKGHVDVPPIEYRARHKDGSYVWIETLARPILDEEGAPKLVQTTSRDVTDRVRRKEWLRLLEASIEHSRVPVLITEADPLSEPGPRIVYANPAFTEVTGYSAEAAIGQSPRFLQGPDTDRATLDCIRKALEAEDPVRKVVRNYRKDGTPYWNDIYIAPVPDDAGEVTHFVSVQNDVTDHVRQREELKLAKEEAEEANRLKSAFLANMSHEIRTPLTSIIGFAEVIGDELDPPSSHARSSLDTGSDTIRQFTRLIEKSGRRLLETLNSVLDLSQLEAGAMALSLEAVNATAEAEEAAELFSHRAREEELTLQTDIAPPPLWVRADRGALQRILHNLLSNAVKFTDPGGSVVLRVRKEQKTVIFEVEDTGAGIDPDFLTHLFDAFKQESTGTDRSHEGSGLGLTVTNRLVDRLDGEIDVDTELGEGTCFTVRLPRASTASVTEPEA